MCMYDRIEAGEFKNKVPYITRKNDPKGSEAFRKGEAAVVQAFKEACFEDMGIENHPKKEVIYARAWNSGHCGGYNEVYTELQDIIDFLTDLGVV